MEDEKLKKICTGMSHTLLLKSDGEVLVAGTNEKGEIGKGHKVKKVRAFETLLKDGTIKNIFCGQSFSVILKEGGDALVFGKLLFGQLGIGIGNHSGQFTPTTLPLPKIANVACGGDHMMLLTEEGELYTVGCNYSGTKLFF